MVSNVFPSLSFRTEINKIYKKNNTHNIITAKKGRNNIKFLCNSIFAHIGNSKGVNNERNLSLVCLNSQCIHCMNSNLVAIFFENDDDDDAQNVPFHANLVCTLNAI